MEKQSDVINYEKKNNIHYVEFNSTVRIMLWCGYVRVILFVLKHNNDIM